MNICECLTVNAKIFPDKVAIVFDDFRFTFAELNELSVRASQYLMENGVEPGDRVALMLPNAPSFPVWYYATLRIGAIAVSVSTRLAPAEVEFVTTDCQAKAFICNVETFESVESAIGEDTNIKLAVEDCNGLPASITLEPTNQSAIFDWYDAAPDEPALILYTSGTTGFPKGATLSHNNVRSNVHAFNHLCGMRTNDVVLLAVPLFHCFGQNALLNSVLNVAGTVVLQQRFDLNESKQLIAQHRITQLYGVPMMFGLLLESCTTSDLESIRYCFSAAATLPIQVSKTWQEKFGMPIFEGYGLTETSPFATYNHRTKFVSGSIGMAIDCVEVKIVDSESGVQRAPGELGEIAIRGPNVMLGYWNRPEDTAMAIRDGWFHSGDIGRLDDDGYLYIVDRVKDMITVGGMKVFPAEVERVILDHPSVLEAAVVGMEDSVFGEQVVGYVVLADNSDQTAVLQEIMLLTNSNLGNYKVPRQIKAVDELPRNPSGKVLKTKLRERTAKDFRTLAHEPSISSSKLQSTTLKADLQNSYVSERKNVAIQFLQEQVARICQLGEVPQPEDSFIEAGLDSLAIVELSAQLQTEINRELPPTLLFDYPRICDMADFLITSIFDDSTHPKTQFDAKLDSQQDEELYSEIEQMSEAEALAELMKEID